MDREKVIKGLEWCMNEKHDCYRENGCPYENEGDDVGCKYALHRDALALLKAQEPRVITEDDFENNPNVDHDGFLPAWIEYRKDGDWNEYWEGQLDEWGVCRADRLVYESIRYWTSRPTDEQMKAVKWE